MADLPKYPPDGEVTRASTRPFLGPVKPKALYLVGPSRGDFLVLCRHYTENIWEYRDELLLRVELPCDRVEKYSIYKEIRALPFSEKEKTQLINELKRRLYEARGKHWTEALPSMVVLWAGQKFLELEEGCECVDNERVARVGSTGQMRRYKRQHEHGCCGFSDTEHIGPDGHRYRLGFNFGH